MMQSRLRALLLMLAVWAGCTPVVVSSPPAPDPAPAPQPAPSPAPVPQPAPAPPAPSTAGTEGTASRCAPIVAGRPLSPEECECHGGRTNPSRGGHTQDHCARGERELGTVRFGIEGGWCCKAGS
jgi:hypothetical protein